MVKSTLMMKMISPSVSVRELKLGNRPLAARRKKREMISDSPMRNN